MEIQEEERVSFSEWSRILFKKWKIILAIFLLTFSISSFSGLYSYHQKKKSWVPVYTSIIKMMLGPVSLEVEAGGGRVIRRLYSYDSEFSLLESNIITRQTALVLKEKYGYSEPADELISEVKATVKLRQSQKGEFRQENLVNIFATSKNPQRACDMANAVVEGYIKQKKEEEDKFFTDTYNTFSKQLNSARENLQKAEEELTAFIIEHEDIAKLMRNYQISGGGHRKEFSDDDGINEQYLTVKSAISSTEEFISNIKEMAEKDKVQALVLIAKRYDQFADLNLKKALMLKEEELSNLLLINEEAHPEVIRARGELKTIEQKIDTEIENAIKNMETDLFTFREEEKQLSQLVKADAHKDVITYKSLKRDIEQKREIYNRLAEQLQSLDLGEKLKRYSEIRILEPAELPLGPSNSISFNLVQLILFSLSMGGFSAAASVYVMEILDTSIRDVEQLEKVIGVPVLVMIPWHRIHKPQKEEQPDT